jgi:hypothetical protein
LIGMLTAVELDDQLLRWAGEIRNPIADRMLTAELQKRNALVERTPEDSFDIGRICSKLARDDASRSETMGRHPPPHPTLSAPKGGEG